MTPAEFIKKWKPVALTERAAAHTHFLDLCKLFEHEDPVSADPTGEWFTFEKGATKTGGGEGFADVWKKNFFAWEYKKKKRDLNAAMDQLVRYAAALENPPLQVVCDTDRFIIRTAWTNTVPKQYEIELDDLALPEKREILWAVFHDPERLRPKETRAGITKEAADKFSTIALRLQGRGTPEEVAHFVNQLVFCFFANSVKLLPEGFFPKLLKLAAEDPEEAIDDLDELFSAMEKGGRFGLEKIAFFNGGLFDGRPALRLESDDIGLLIAAGSLDWSQIDPTIFGTLFERFLDPDKRAQIGAHYTDPEKIMMIVEPVILRPLRAEWGVARARIEALLRDPEEALNHLMATCIGVDDLHDEVVEIQRSLSIRLQLELFPELQRARRQRSSDTTRAELRSARDRVVAARRDGEGVRQDPYADQSLQPAPAMARRCASRPRCCRCGGLWLACGYFRRRCARQVARIESRPCQRWASAGTYRRAGRRGLNADRPALGAISGVLLFERTRRAAACSRPVRGVRSQILAARPLGCGQCGISRP